MPNGSPLPKIIFANKYDKVEEFEVRGSLDKFMTQEHLDEFATQNDFLGAFRVSAKKGTNINEAIFQLIFEVLRQNSQSVIGGNNNLEREKSTTT